MTTEQKLSALEGLCERVYEMGKDILDPNVKDTKKKIVAMTQVAGAFMGGYDSYKCAMKAETWDMCLRF